MLKRIISIKTAERYKKNNSHNSFHKKMSETVACLYQVFHDFLLYCYIPLKSTLSNTNEGMRQFEFN